MTTVTQQEWNVLTFIQSYQERNHCAPKVNDIRHALRLESKQQTNDILFALARKNLVRRYGRQRERGTVWYAQCVGRGEVGLCL